MARVHTAACSVSRNARKLVSGSERPGSKSPDRKKRPGFPDRSMTFAAGRWLRAALCAFAKDESFLVVFEINFSQHIVACDLLGYDVVLGYSRIVSFQSAGHGGNNFLPFDEADVHIRSLILPFHFVSAGIQLYVADLNSVRNIYRLLIFVAGRRGDWQHHGQCHQAC